MGADRAHPGSREEQLLSDFPGPPAQLLRNSLDFGAKPVSAAPWVPC